jgi:hypothetical protein
MMNLSKTRSTKVSRTAKVTTTASPTTDMFLKMRLRCGMNVPWGIEDLHYATRLQHSLLTAKLSLAIGQIGSEGFFECRDSDTVAYGVV